MSLINDMLRDLESRRKHEQKGSTFAELPIAVSAMAPSIFRWQLFGPLLLILVVVGCLGIWLFPFTSQGISEEAVTAADKQEANTKIVAESPQSERVQNLSPEQQALGTTESIISENSEVVIPAKTAVTKLLAVIVSNTTTSTRLTLSFSDLPKYRLEQGRLGDAKSKLVISFSGVQMDENLEIPERTGEMVERVSLRPQQKRLELLVDLKDQFEVGSYELKENDESGYSLQIDIHQQTPSIAAADKKTMGPQEVTEETERTIPQKSTEQVQEVSLHSKHSDEPAHLNRSKNRLSLDKQAYQSGLEQMRHGSYGAAEKSFTTALNINPVHVQARLQLISVLQQQNKTEQAQTQMQEGLAQTPQSLQLRKTYARFLLSKQYNQEAIEVLRAKPFPAVAQDLEYHALLAALLQETKQFNAAARAYAGLLQLRPETALWWFGLAVSMDQSGNFEQARNAYRRALALPGLSVDVQKYVNDRLQVL